MTSKTDLAAGKPLYENPIYMIVAVLTFDKLSNGIGVVRV